MGILNEEDISKIEQIIKEVIRKNRAIEKGLATKKNQLEKIKLAFVKLNDFGIALFAAGFPLIIIGGVKFNERWPEFIAGALTAGIGAYWIVWSSNKLNI